MAFIILDRDGVINYDSEAYIKSPNEWHPIPGSLEAIAALNQHGFTVLVASNQSGVARGYYDLPMLNKIHEKLHQTLAQVGGKIEEIFFCPHHPDEHCSCRKPRVGMFYQIADKYPVEFTDTFFIGDSYVDVAAARNVGLMPLLVKTGNGLKALERYPELLNVPHFSDLAEAVQYVITRKSR